MPPASMREIPDKLQGGVRSFAFAQDLRFKTDNFPDVQIIDACALENVERPFIVLLGVAIQGRGYSLRVSTAVLLARAKNRFGEGC